MWDSPIGALDAFISLRLRVGSNLVTLTGPLAHTGNTHPYLV